MWIINMEVVVCPEGVKSAAKKANGVLSYSRQCCQKAEGGDFSPLLTLRQLESFVQCWVSQYKRHFCHWIESSEGSQRCWRDRSISPMRKRLGSWDLSAEPGGDSGESHSMSINPWREDAKKMEPGSCQWHPVQDKRQWAQTGTQTAFSEQQKIFLIGEGGWATGTAYWGGSWGFSLTGGI